MGISLKQEIINCKNNFSQFKNNQLVEPAQFFKILPNKFFPRKIASAFKGPLAFSASKLKNLHWYFIVCTFILHLAISRQFSLQFLFKSLVPLRLFVDDVEKLNTLCFSRRQFISSVSEAMIGFSRFFMVFMRISDLVTK